MLFLIIYIIFAPRKMKKTLLYITLPFVALIGAYGKSDKSD